MPHRSARPRLRTTPPAAWRFAALIALVAAACGTASTSPPATPTAPPPTSTATPTPAPTPAPTPTPTAAPTGPPSPAPFDPSGLTIDLAPVVDGLESPVFVTHAGDGSGRFFVIEQAGRIRVVRDGRLVTRPFLDLTDRVGAGGERGLLGLAFHPGYASNGRFVVDYTDLDGDTVVAEFRAPDPAADRADPGSERTILAVGQPFANHNGGMVAFGPGGFLHVGLGDGGGGGDPLGVGQDPMDRLGKILRVNIDGEGGGRRGERFAVPRDNPFVGRSDALPEILAIGLRNPWRFSFDRLTGDLWIGDVGQGRREEIDRARPTDGRPAGHGLNLGWNVMEGSACYRAESCRTAGLTLPLAEYGHGDGCSVTGGYVYRGSAQPDLFGGYVFGDYCSGNVWAVSADGPDRQAETLLLASDASITSFGEDEAGELYLVDHRGAILRLVARRG